MTNKEWLRDYVQEVQVRYFIGDDVLCKSESASLDVNDHIREVANYLESSTRGEIRGGTFDIYYKGKRMFAGDGPNISPESIRLIAELHAGIVQDIYCMCNEPEGNKDDA
jgi:hypothetical protein